MPISNWHLASIWGRKGFDGDFEAGGASSGGYRFNKSKF